MLEAPAVSLCPGLAVCGLRTRSFPTSWKGQNQMALPPFLTLVPAGRHCLDLCCLISTHRAPEGTGTMGVRLPLSISTTCEKGQPSPASLPLPHWTRSPTLLSTDSMSDFAEFSLTVLTENQQITQAGVLRHTEHTHCPEPGLCNVVSPFSACSAPPGRTCQRCSEHGDHCVRAEAT